MWSASPGTLFGELEFKLRLSEDQKIRFESRCILEAGVFNDTEQDPFGVEAAHTVRRGVEGEWQGIAKDFPTKGKSSLVVASLAVWTTTDSNVPRFKLDIATASPAGPGQCLIESTPVLGFGSTALGGDVEISAPNQNSDRAICTTQQQEQQEG